ncbi:DUF2752 domain-containing protein [Actinoplanes aureus]|uniref:DUF2752 domain-containing protein n=1 Tax=Actinoplanes aureus TaxID=2792083 RepID=A0A931C8E1_9ACTN|nr:DUF2752 domain-containing protein [Actinoplanes aureus]MBG0560230.1 DUF2752 domain-containing protein [Actinoplanes aureus]
MIFELPRSSSVPCPACGMTTAAVAFVRGQFGAAFHANPLIFGLAALTVASGALVALRAGGVLANPRPLVVPPRWSPPMPAGASASGPT